MSSLPPAQYLAATGCPLPPQPRLPALLWLLSQAVALEYRDTGAWLPDEAFFALSGNTAVGCCSSRAAFT